MRIKIIAAFSALLFFSAGHSQTIEAVKCLNKLSDTRFVTLLSDSTIWWSVDGAGWKQLSTRGLPARNKIKIIDIYMKVVSLSMSTRLLAVLDDNSIWWTSGDNDPWEKVPSAGLPKKASIKILKPYVKVGAFGATETRFAAVLDDNTIWWYALNKDWEQVTTANLPSSFEITGLGTYQKSGLMGGSETRYVITLADKSIWWYDGGKKWMKLESSGLPADASFKNFNAYMKMSGLEGRLIGVLSDESIWWFATNGKTWKKLDLTGLPAGYKVKSLEVYQKWKGIEGDTRLVVLLDDNTIWWYAEGKGWTHLNTTTLIK